MYVCIRDTDRNEVIEVFWIDILIALDILTKPKDKKETSDK